MIILKKGGIIEVRGKRVNYTADDLFEINSAQLKFVGPSDFSEDITVNGKSFLKHIHKDGDNADTTAPI